MKNLSKRTPICKNRLRYNRERCLRNLPILPPSTRVRSSSLDSSLPPACGAAPSSGAREYSAGHRTGWFPPISYRRAVSHADLPSAFVQSQGPSRMMASTNASARPKDRSAYLACATVDRTRIDSDFDRSADRDTERRSRS